MSVASPNARSAHGIPAPKSQTELLRHMKLRAPSDPIVHQKLSQWVAFQKYPSQIHPNKIPACQISSTLLLQRLVRAFENRQSSSSNDAKKTKVSAANNSRSHPSTPTNGATATTSGKGQNKLPKKLPSLSALMQRKVKVTHLVKKAVQFVGSDVLKVLQVLVPSPTVADVANFCLGILNNETKIKEFYVTFSEALGKDPSTVDEASPIFFGVFALQALQSLRAQAIASYEFSHDFEMIYRTCYQDKNFQLCMHELNPAINPLERVASSSFAHDTEARNICWKLARLLAMNNDRKNKSNPEMKDHRRNRILISATSIVFAANIGKSVKNCEVAGSQVSAQDGRIPDNEDFVALVTAPVSDLIIFLAKSKSQNQGITPIRAVDIHSHVMETCKLINYMGFGERENEIIALPNSKSLLARAFSPSNHRALVRDYRNVISTIVTVTQIELKDATTSQGGGSVRTGIVDVLLFFPMVIGEPWGIHRDAPMITSKMLCLGENSKPSDPLKDSVAVVMKMYPRPKVISGKATSSTPNTPGSIQTTDQKAKTILLTESPKTVSKEPIDVEGEGSTSPAPKRRKIEAPFINDLSELNEWIVSILSVSVIKPTDALLTYLGEIDRTRGDGSSCLQDVVVPVLNRGALRIQSALRSSSGLNSEAMATKLSVGRRDGQVYVNGAVDEHIQLCASIVGFYYYSLEALIQDQMERMDFLGSFGSQLQSTSFHRALLACCYFCILKAVGMNQKLRMNGANENISVQILLDCTESDPYTLLKVIEAFSRALIATKEATQHQNGSPIVAGLPIILSNHVQKIESQLIDSVLWSTPVTTEESAQKCFVLAIKAMKSLPSAWPPDILEPLLPEEIVDLESNSSKSSDVRYKPSFGSTSEANFISFVLRKLLKFTFFRIRAMCAALNLSDEGALHTQILVAFRYLLRRHISIFNDRHVDQLLLCTIYGVCRVMKIQPTISFGKVIDAYFAVREDQGERACRIIVRHVKLASPGNGSRSSSQVVGNIVVFYNTVYIPKMQKYYLGSKSLKEAGELYQQNCQKEGRYKENHASEKKIQAVSTVPDKSSNAAVSTVATGAAVVATQTSHSTSSLTTSEAVGSEKKNIPRNDSPDASSEKRNGRDENPITVDLTNKTSSPTSAKELPETSDDSPMEGVSNEISKSDSTSSSSVKENRTVNGQIASETTADLDMKKASVSTVVEGEKASAEIVNKGPQVSNSNASQGPSNPSSTSPIEKVASPSNEMPLTNGTKISWSSTDAVVAEADAEKERTSVEPTFRTEGNADGSQKGELPQTVGETTTATTSRTTTATSSSSSSSSTAAAAATTTTSTSTSSSSSTNETVATS